MYSEPLPVRDLGHTHRDDDCTRRSELTTRDLMEFSRNMNALLKQMHTEAVEKAKTATGESVADRWLRAWAGKQSAPVMEAAKS